MERIPPLHGFDIRDNFGVAIGETAAIEWP
jgi:hypothetical protein